MKRQSRYRELFVCLLVFLIASKSYGEEGPAGQLPEEVNKGSKVEERNKQAAVLGESAESDYLAKNFSLVIGGIAVNQFELTPLQDQSDPPQPLLDANNVQRFGVDGGGSTTNAFIEAGYRYRWAWLDRKLVSESIDSRLEYAIRETSGVARQDLQKIQRRFRDLQFDSNAKQRKLGETLAAASAKLAEAQSLQETFGSRSASAEKKELEKRIKQAELDKSNAAAALQNEKEQFALDKADVARTLRYYEASREYMFGVPSLNDSGSLYERFIPTDWSIRLGYAFGSDTDRNAIGIAGSSDLYLEVDMGWNLVRWTFPTSGPEEIPIRGAFSFEVGTSLATQDELLDIQGRHFIGFSSAIGVPIGPERAGKNAPIAEIMARVGWVRAERPEYISRFTNEVETRNGVVDYQSENGWGLDIEMNIPISEKLGYIMLRGRANKGFDPNPWSIVVGYTVPIQSIFSGFAAGS